MKEIELTLVGNRQHSHFRGHGSFSFSNWDLYIYREFSRRDKSVTVDTKGLANFACHCLATGNIFTNEIRSRLTVENFIRTLDEEHKAAFRKALKGREGHSQLTPKETLKLAKAIFK